MSKETEYRFPVQLKGGTNIELIMNRILRPLMTAHLTFAPHTFSNKSEIATKIFYDLCLFGIYAESLVERLKDWQKDLDEYFREYKGSWRFYSSCGRMEYIREFGGEDSDYDGDGNIVQTVDKETLMSFSIIGNLIVEDGPDIVQDTTVSDLDDICTCIQMDAEVTADFIMKSMFGKTIPSYRQDENGNMVEITWAEKLLRKANKSVEADDLVGYLVIIVLVVRGITNKLKSLRKDQDNIDELREIQTDVQNLINLDLCKFQKYVKEKFGEIKK